MVAVIAGEIIAARNMEMLVGVLLCVILWCGMNYSEGFFIFEDGKICIGRLISIGVFMAAGFILYNTQSTLYSVTDNVKDGTEGKLRGEVYDIVERENGRTIVLKNVMFEYEGADENDVNIIYTDKVYLYDKGGSNISIGDEAGCDAAVYMEFTGARNKGNFNDENYYHSIGITALFYGKEVCTYGSVNSLTLSCRRALYSLRKNIQSIIYNICDRDTASVLEAMLLGNRQNMDEETTSVYKDAGIFHVCCISGTHMAIIGLGLYKFLRKRKGYAFSVAVTGSVVIGYGMLAGMGMSVMRAVIMILVKLCAELMGRTYDMISAMSLSSIIIICISPFSIYNTGFILSYAAVAGICFVAPVLNKIFVKPGSRMEKLWQSIMFSAGIQLATIPIVAYTNFEVPLCGIILNIIVIPCMTYIILSGIMGIFLGCITVTGGRFVIAMAAYGAKFYKFVSGKVLMIPFMQCVTGKPNLWQIAVYYIILTAVLYTGWRFYNRDGEFPEDFFYVRCIKRVTVILTVMALAFVIVYRQHGKMDIHMIDVGQGDCINIRTEDGSNFLIDGGSSDISECGKYRILPCLKAEGVKRIDYVVITHGDEDHINAVTTLMEERVGGKSYVSNLVIPDIHNYEEVFSELLSSAGNNNVNVELIRAGDMWKDTSYEIKCMYPCDKEAYDDSVDINEKSTVLKVTSGDFSMLCMGDLGESGEKKLIEYYGEELRSLSKLTVLKTGHHGSKNSSCQEFLDIIKPELAIISCGINNRYGHPGKETLDRLDKVGCGVLRTDIQGEISVVVDGRGYVEVEYGQCQ